MTPSLCEQLDDFLLGELDRAAADRFQSHLSDCAACRSEVDAQGAVDIILSQASEHLEACPPTLAPQVTRTLRSARRGQILRWSASTIAACAILCAWVFSPSPHPAKRDVGPPVAQAVAPRQPADEPAVKVEFPDDFIGVPIKSSNPKITIYRVYPVIRFGEQADASKVQEDLHLLPQRSEL